MDTPVFHNLETPRLRLRPFTLADLPTLLAYRNDPMIARYQSWESMTDAEGRSLIAEMQQRQPGVAGPGFQFAVALKPSNLHIGDCFFKLLDYDPRQAEIGYSLARAQWGQGFATEALSTLLAYSFRTLDLHRVIAVTACENCASIALLERLHMRREGHFLKSSWLNGTWGDEYQYAILGEEWRSGHASEPMA